MNKTETKKTTAMLSFAAIDPYLEETMPRPVETEVRGKNYVEWGTRNAYPSYLLELYNTVPTLRSIINGNVDFITGDDVRLDIPNRPGFMRREIREQVKNIARDFEIYGGFALQVIRDFTGQVAEVHYIDLRFLRTDKECTVFRYCEDWATSGSHDITVYPAFVEGLDWAGLTPEERDRHASSILYIKNEHTQTYPSPLYAASVKDCEIERAITDFHYNSLENGFVSSAIVNFNNGVPTDEIREEIERDFNEKFSGHRNAGRIVFSWNRNKESATEITEPKVEDFGERYKALATHSRQQIFSAFRAIPALFGIMTESTGFNEQEFQQAFRLYNRTQVRPVQRLIADAYEMIFNVPGCLNIKPFTLDGDAVDTIVN